MLQRRRGLARVLVPAAIAVGCACCTEVVVSPPLRDAPNGPSPSFQARRASVEVTPLPSSLAGAISKEAPFTLSYREKVAQKYSGIPDGIALYITGVLHLFGVPLGTNEVKVDAELTISAADRVPYSLHANATASCVYGFYYGARMSQLDDQARLGARSAIDQQVLESLSGWLAATGVASEAPLAGKTSQGESRP